MKNEPIRIAQIIGKWVGGGVEAVVMNYYTHIDRTKIQFDFICDSDSTNIPYEQIESLGGKVILIPPYQKVFKYQKELRKVLKEGKYKIVHSHINTLSVFPLSCAKKVGVPVRIAHSHSTVIFDRREFKRSILKLVFKNFSKIYANKFIACSDQAAISQFGKKTYVDNLVYILPNSIDLKKFRYNPDIRKKYRDKLKIESTDFVIGHVGRFVTTKNHMYLLDIFLQVLKKKNDSKLLLIGQGPLLDEIREKIVSIGIKNNVILLGQKNNINDYYQVMDSFVLPSLYEGMPVVGIEAQAEGLPCYFSKNMSKDAKILDTTFFLDINDDASIWATNILSNINIERKNTTYYMNKYDIEETSKKLCEYYLELNNICGE